MSGTQISTHILMGFVAEAFPVMVFTKQMPDGTRRFMEIVEATGIKDGAVQAHTLFRFDNEKFVQAGGISDNLADTLMENGADMTSVNRYKEVQT
jgi:pilus assembly protein CpaF